MHSPQIIARDLARALQPASIMHEAGISPDPWQERVLTSDIRRLLLLCSRQSGKSTTVAGKAVQTAIYDPGLILVIAPAQRQSGELFRKCKSMYLELANVPSIVQETQLSMTLANGSRIVALPGTEHTLRGFSDPRLIIVDEASRVEDSLYHAVAPMLAVSQGQLVALTTPYGKRGWFWEAWEDGGERWERTMVTAHDCPRIDPEWLEEQRGLIGDWAYRQEFMCEFVDTEEQFFSSELIEAALDSEVTPLWL